MSLPTHKIDLFSCECLWPTERD